MEKKIVKAAKIAKENGFNFISSVVKSHFATTYFNVVSVDEIISKGDWIAAGRHFHGYRVGQSSIPEKTISRVEAFRLVK